MLVFRISIWLIVCVKHYVHDSSGLTIRGGQPHSTLEEGVPRFASLSIYLPLVPNLSFSEEDLEGKTEEEIEMMKTMGFATFDTTKVSGFSWHLNQCPRVN